jgi:hypothetical protein
MSLFRRGLFVVGVAGVVLAALVLAAGMWATRLGVRTGKALLGWLASALMEDEVRPEERRERTAW